MLFSIFIKTLDDRRVHILNLQIMLSWERLRVCGKIEFKISLTFWKKDLKEDKTQFGSNSLAGNNQWHRYKVGSNWRGSSFVENILQVTVDQK